jgi:hypothetical protein
MAQVFLHVGLPKTGTTSIQAALQNAARELSDVGVLFPCGTHRAQRMAAYDLLGQRERGGNAGAASGAFLASSARATRFQLEKSALVRARDNRLLGWAVRRYLRHTSAF